MMHHRKSKVIMANSLKKVVISHVPITIVKAVIIIDIIITKGATIIRAKAVMVTVPSKVVTAIIEAVMATVPNKEVIIIVKAVTATVLSKVATIIVKAVTTTVPSKEATTGTWEAVFNKIADSVTINNLAKERVLHRGQSV